MVYVSLEDFYEKAGRCSRLTREEEIECAKRMNAGDEEARQMLIDSYTSLVAGRIQRAKPHMQNLGLVIYCMHALNRAVDSFNFLQDSETFTHRLSWCLRQAFADYLVK